MHKSKRLGAIVVALCTVLSSLVVNSQFLGAQAAEKVQPMFAVRAAGNTGVVGFSPAEIRKAYGFDQIVNGGAGQTIGIVNSFDHPSIEQDLNLFSGTFGLPLCTTQNGCFRKIYANSDTAPPVNELWALEIALDVEWAHAIAPAAKILLVEAADDQLATLMQAVDIAVQNGATVVSMSWGLLNEIPNEVTYDSHFVRTGVSFFASSGDLGHGTTYPAASPFVTAVGGTNLKLAKNGSYSGETAWSGSGGGLSQFEPAPAHQIAYPIPNNPLLKRGMPDVAYLGDPSSGVAVYNSVPFQGTSGWWELGGTSAGAPQWAALFAIANSLRAKAHRKPLTGSQGVLYDIAKENAAANFNDVVKGKNDNCGSLCTAAPGFDYVTGLGTPRAQFLIPALKNK